MSAAPVRPSTNFQYAEFVGRGGCGDLTLQQRQAIAWLATNWLQPLRRQFGRTNIISGCRTRAHNRAVGGAPNSFHIYDEHAGVAAADFTCERGSPRDWYQFLDELGAPGLGLYSGHVHIDSRSGRARW